MKDELIRELAQKYSLKLLLLFGSRATDNYRQDSDFDVAYLSSRNLDLMEESRLIIDLAPLFLNNWLPSKKTSLWRQIL